MVVRTSKSAFRTLLVCCLLACAGLATKSARAEESIIRHPGDHPNYSVEIEPHVLAAFLALPHGGDGFGLGGRFTIPLVKNGFVSSINNNVGIGFGLDWVHYSGCYYNNYYNGPFPYECPTFNAFVIPVVLQWNFFLSTHWSVFGEPGFAIEYGTWGGDFCGYYVDRGVRVPYACGNSPNHLSADPFILFIGGRFHFSESASLTMRVGWPYFSIGISFFP
jgi:hypothetical protein